MNRRRLPAEEAAVRRYVEELWLPYHRELEDTAGSHALANDVDLVSEEVAFRLDRLESEDYRAWIAVDDQNAVSEGDDPIAEIDGDFAGFVTTSVEECPTVFDRPDRSVIGDVYVRDPHRGTGLAHDLVDRAAERAREVGCGEVALDVDVDNERAIACYEKLGFETIRRRMTSRVNELASPERP